MKRAALALLLFATSNCGPTPESEPGTEAVPAAATPAENAAPADGPPFAPTGGLHVMTECSPGGPPADGVQLFGSQNWGGICKQWRMDRRPHSGVADLQGFNGWANSFRVGSDVRLSLFFQTGFRRKFLTASENVPALSFRPSSIRIELREISSDCSNLKDGQVAYYEHAHFQGDCFVVEGTGNHMNLSDFGFANDSLSSLRNRLNTQVFVYEHANRGPGGRNEVFQGRSDYFYVGDRVNDRTTYIEQ